MPNLSKPLLVFPFLILFLAACKKDKAPGGAAAKGEDEQIEEVTAAINTAKEACSNFLYFMEQSNMDTVNSFMGAAQSIFLDREVAEVGSYGTHEILVTYKSGMKVRINWNPVDENNQALLRGGAATRAGAGAPLELGLQALGEQKLIGNKKILFFSPAFDLDTRDDYFKQQVASYSPDFEVDIKHQQDANLEALEEIGDYGLVIINTHGHVGSFQVYSGLNSIKLGKIEEELPADEVRDAIVGDKDYLLEGLADGSLELGINFTTYPIDPQTKLGLIKVNTMVLATSEYIRKLPEMKDAVVYLNFCYSGHSADGLRANNLPEAFKAIGAETVYGYAHLDGTSRPVWNNFALAMQDSLLKNLIEDVDTTGIAHLAANVLPQNNPPDRRPTYSHTFFQHTDPWEDNQMTNEEYLASFDYTFDIPRINHDLWFQQYFDEGYSYGCGTFTDPRDGVEYALACIGDQVWFAENLRWEGAGACYDNRAASCNTFGRLYTWTELTQGVDSDANPSGVQGICPTGWHVPSMAEWQELLTFVGGASQAGPKLQANSPLWVDADPNTDDYGFAALPAGRCDQPFDCYNEDDQACFWSSSATGTYAGYILMQGINYVGELSDDVNTRFSCRCVQDE